MICPGRTLAAGIRSLTPVVAITMSQRAMISSSVAPSAPIDLDALDRLGVAVRTQHLADAVGAQQPHDAGARRAQPDLADGAHAQAASQAPRRRDQRRQRHHRRAVLVVVQHRLVEHRAQPRLDLEALRRREILQLDGAEGLLDGA